MSTGRYHSQSPFINNKNRRLFVLKTVKFRFRKDCIESAFAESFISPCNSKKKTVYLVKLSVFQSKPIDISVSVTVILAILSGRLSNCECFHFPHSCYVIVMMKNRHCTLIPHLNSTFFLFLISRLENRG